MSLFREQRRSFGRSILSFGRKLKASLFGKPDLPDKNNIPNNILIIRPFFLGDILLCLPVAQDLKKANPSCKISWLLREEWEDLLRNHSAVDEVIGFSQQKMHGWKSLGESFRVIRQLRKKRFDLIINLSWDRSTAWWCWLSGAKSTVAIEEFGRPRLVSLLYSSTIIAPERSIDNRHMADFYFEPMKLMGFETRREDPKVHATPDENEEVEIILSEPSEKTLLIHPGGRLGNKRWDPNRFSELLDRLAGSNEFRELKIVLVCGPAEESWACELSKHLPEGRGVFVAAPTLGQFMALASRARLFVGNDSGPMHLAAASGCPVLALFGVDSTRWRPLGEKSEVIENRSGLDKISVNDVYDRIQNAMKANPK